MDTNKSPLLRAPFVRASFSLGILSLLCILIPLAIVAWMNGHPISPAVGLFDTMLGPAVVMAMLAGPFGLGAILLHLRARHFFRDPENSYLEPGRVGWLSGSAALVVCLVGLVMLVITSSASGRARAKDRAARINLSTGLSELAEVVRNRVDKGEPGALRRIPLESLLGAQDQSRNPWNHRAPARQAVLRIEGTSLEEVEALACKEATTLGEVVFVVSVPSGPGRVRYVAGAVLTKGLDLPTPGGRPSSTMHISSDGVISSALIVSP